MPKRASGVKLQKSGGTSQVVLGLAQLGAVLRAGTTRAGGERNLSAAQQRTLDLLRHAPEGMRLGEIASQLGVSAPSASDTVRLLVERGFVRRVVDRSDGRAARFHLPSTLRRSSSLKPASERGLDQAVASLPAKDAAALQRAIVHIILTLQQQGQIPVARACVNCRFFRPRIHASVATPHHCDYVNRPFGDASLRVLCPEFESAPNDLALTNQERWRSERPPA